MYNKKIKLNI